MSDTVACWLGVLGFIAAALLMVKRAMGAQCSESYCSSRADSRCFGRLCTRHCTTWCEGRCLNAWTHDAASKDIAKKLLERAK